MAIKVSWCSQCLDEAKLLEKLQTENNSVQTLDVSKNKLSRFPRDTVKLLPSVSVIRAGHNELVEMGVLCNLNSSYGAIIVQQLIDRDSIEHLKVMLLERAVYVIQQNKKTRRRNLLFNNFARPLIR